MKISSDTELGAVPSDWKIAKLGDLGLDISDGNYASKYPKHTDFVEQGIPFIRANNIRGFRVIWDDMRYITTEKHSELQKGHLKENDILITTRGQLGNVALVTKEFEDCNINAQIVRINTKDVLNPQFFLFVLSSDSLQRIIRGLKTGTTLPQLPIGKLKSIILPIPAIKEQENIVHILYQIQSAVETQCKIIKTTTELKNVLMQKLFTEGLKGEAQKVTEIGKVPKSWEVTMIDKLGEIVTGTTPPTKNRIYYADGGFQFISPADLGGTKYVYKTVKEISIEGLSVSRVLPKDTVLVVCIGSTTGKVGMTFQDKSATNQQINAIICKNDFNSHYIYYLLDFHKGYIRSLSTPSPVPILTKGQFQKAAISITRDKQEQDETARILSTLDKKIECATLKQQKLQGLFQSMLHHLMTGQIRVSDIKFS